MFLLSAAGAFAANNFLPTRSTPVPASEQIPVVDFVRPELFEQPILNPAGTYFAALSKNEHLQEIAMICEIATGKVSWSMGNIEGFEWIDNEHFSLNSNLALVFDVKSPTKRINYQTILPGDKRGLVPETGFSWAWPLSERLPPDTLQVFRRWSLPENGQTGYCVALKRDSKMHLYRFERSEWLECPVALDEVSVIGPGEHPHEVFVLVSGTKGRTSCIQRLDVISGALGEVIYQDPQYDCVAEVYFRRGTRHIIGVVVPGRPAEVAWLDETHQQVQNMINRQFPGSLAKIVDTDMAEKKFLVEVQSDRQPPIYYLLDFQKKSLGLLKNSAPWIDPARMRPVEVIGYKSRDGLALEALLTLPAEASKEHPVPLLVSLHSGPWNGRYAWGWNGWAQLMASRGYAVLQPNYRGSTGYDSHFEITDHFDFQKMSEDVTDSVVALIKSGVIDQNRIAIEGTGFGGYLALCATLEDPARYRCAITFGGVFDWEKLFRKKDSRTMYQDYWLQSRLAAYNLIPPSPLKRKGEIKVPLFITRNVRVKDITWESQVSDLYAAVKNQVPCVNFGDLNIYVDEEAYGEIVTRTEKIEQFLATYCAKK